MTATELAAKVRDLAPASHTALKLITLLNRPANQNQELVQLLKFDNVLTAKLLRACNSPTYGLEEPVATVEQAVMILGYLRLLQIVFALSFNDTMNQPLPGYAAAAGEIWRHSLITALTCEALAKMDTPVPAAPAVAFTAGLLHDLGKLALNNVLDHTQLSAIRSGITNQKHSCREMEQSILGTDHAEVGGCLLQNWNLPTDLVEAVRNHHQPTCHPQPELSAIVHVADRLAHQKNADFPWDALTTGTAPGTIDALQLTETNLAGIRAALKQSQAQANDLMKLS